MSAYDPKRIHGLLSSENSLSFRSGVRLTLASRVSDQSPDYEHSGSHPEEHGYGVEPFTRRLVKRNGDAKASPEQCTQGKGPIK
jgi:hypothetical protein